MNLIIYRERINFILFILCVLVPVFNNFELTFAVWSLTTLITLRRKYSFNFTFLIGLFFLLLLLAFGVGISKLFNTYFVIRDITYLVKPILGLLIGYQLFYDNNTNHLKYIVYAGFIVACYHMILVIYAYIFKDIPNIHVLRYHAGYFNDFEIYSLTILIFSDAFKFKISKINRISFIIILGLSTLFYFARTNFIQLMILVVAMMGYFTFSKRKIIIIISSILILGIGYSIVYNYNPKRNGKGLESFLYKIKNAPIEAFKTKIDIEDYKDFNDNYRSYENIRTVEQLLNKNHIVFGEGLGSQVDLKQEVFLGDMMLRYISILHNGFMTVLLKTGLIGLIIYLFTIFYFFKNKNYDDQIINSIKLLLIGTGVFLFISNWVFMGFYNLSDTKTIVVAYLIRYREYLSRQVSI